MKQAEARPAEISFTCTEPLPDIAKALNLSLPELQPAAGVGREKLLAYREKRVHPHKDDKILTDWNGLMIAALANGARVLDEPAYANAAARAVDFILGNMTDSEGRLLHRYRDGEAAIAGNLDDYAFLIHGMLELYETTFKVGLSQKGADVEWTLAGALLG